MLKTAVAVAERSPDFFLTNSGFIYSEKKEKIYDDLPIGF